MFHRTVGPNWRGRDFIIGDLHGCYQALLSNLKELSFNPAVDRVFSVGDLVDRGPGSFVCLELLKKPWLFAVRGNHEQNLLACWQSGNFDAGYLQGEGRWLRELSASQAAVLQDELMPLVAALPHVLRVEDVERPFNVLHAEAVRCGSYWDDEDLTELDESASYSSLLWGRELLEQDDSEGAWCAASLRGEIRVPPEPFALGLSLTYVGHTVVPPVFPAPLSPVHRPRCVCRWSTLQVGRSQPPRRLIAAA